VLGQVPEGRRPWLALVSGVPLAAIFMPGAGSLSLHVLQKAGYLGSAEPPWLQPYAADAALGALVAASTLAAVGFLVPWIAASWGPRLKVALVSQIVELQKICSFAVGTVPVVVLSIANSFYLTLP
jgi:hypothetical protein